jgi:hypothetical protein
MAAITLATLGPTAAAEITRTSQHHKRDAINNSRDTNNTATQETLLIRGLKHRFSFKKITL